MKTDIKIKSIFGEVLFEYKCNTIKECLLEALNQGANLRGADLQGANLQGADLQGAYLPIYCKWDVSIKDDTIQIGCKNKTIKEWDEFFASDKVIETKRDTEDFKRIEAMYLAYKAYYQHMNK